MSRRMAVILSALALVASLALATPVTAGQAPPPLACGSVTAPASFGDIRDQVCATVSNALSRSAAAGSVGVANSARAGSATVSIEIPASEETPENPEDSLYLANLDGSVTVLRFPANSLRNNFPGNEDYDPALPIGMLTLSPGALTSESRISHLPAPRPMLSASGLSQEWSNCLWFSSDGSSQTVNTASQINVCWRRYKPTNGDSDPNFNYRVVFSNGSAHGGNTMHKMKTADATTDMGTGGNITDWSPTSTKSVASEQSYTVTLGVSGPGYSGSVSHTFTLYPTLYGLREINTNTDLFKHGWVGSKSCEEVGGSCKYEGLGGGIQFKYSQGSSLPSMVYSVHMTWGY